MRTDELANALIEEPLGGVCGFCNGPNTFADDCGFFYLVPLNYLELKEKKVEIKSLPCCEPCYFGEAGKNHVKIFGLGER